MSDRQSYAFRYFVDRGYSPVAAAGIVGGLRGETADLNTNQVHDNGIGYGISGWNGPRLDALRRMYGEGASNLDNQLAFVDHELKTSEGKAYSALQAARTPEEAGSAMLAYFRPKDWNVPGAHPERGRYAGEVFRTANGGTVGPYEPVNTAAPAAPAPTKVADLFSNFGGAPPVQLTLPQQSAQVPPVNGGGSVLSDPALQLRTFQMPRMADRFARQRA